MRKMQKSGILEHIANVLPCQTISKPCKLFLKNKLHSDGFAAMMEAFQKFRFLKAPHMCTQFSQQCLLLLHEDWRSVSRSADLTRE